MQQFRAGPRLRIRGIPSRLPAALRCDVHACRCRRHWPSYRSMGNGASGETRCLWPSICGGAGERGKRRPARNKQGVEHAKIAAALLRPGSHRRSPRSRRRGTAGMPKREQRRASTVRAAAWQGKQNRQRQRLRPAARSWRARSAFGTRSERHLRGRRSSSRSGETKQAHQQARRGQRRGRIDRHTAPARSAPPGR